MGAQLVFPSLEEYLLDGVQLDLLPLEMYVRNGVQLELIFLYGVPTRWGIISPLASRGTVYLPDGVQLVLLPAEGECTYQMGYN